MRYVAFTLMFGPYCWLLLAHTDFWKRFKADGGNPRLTRQTSPITGKQFLSAIAIFAVGMVLLFLSLLPN